MKPFKRYFLLPFILILLSINSFSEITNETISSSPKQLSIEAIQGETIQRNVLLETSQKKIEEIQPITLDLISKNNKDVLTKQHINIKSDSSNIEPYKPINLPIIIKLDNVPSGHYEGNIRLQYSDGHKNIPIDISVKDHYFLPMLLLLFGVSLAFGLTYYKEHGKSRDELLLQVYNLTQKMKQKEFNPPSGIIASTFYHRINNLLIDIEDELNDENWAEAKEFIEKAELFWKKWIKGKDDWKKLSISIEEQQKLISTLGSDKKSLYLKSINNKVDQFVKECPDNTSTNILRNHLNEISSSLQKYKMLKSKTNNQELLNELDLLPIEDVDGIKKLEIEIVKSAKGITKGKVPQQNNFESFSNQDFPQIEEEFNEIQNNTINITGTYFSKEVINATNNLQMLSWITFILTVTVIAGTGFSKLYLEVSTFGENRWSDYFSLFIWGFSAEATRSVLIDTIKKWDFSSKKVQNN